MVRVAPNGKRALKNNGKENLTMLCALKLVQLFVNIAPKIMQGEKRARWLAVLSNNYMARWKPINPADIVTSNTILLGLPGYWKAVITWCQEDVMI